MKRFVELMKGAGGDVQGRLEAGRMMWESHQSYCENLGLGCSETELLSELLRERGVKEGFYGARMTGEGGGGVIAVLGETGETFRRGLEEICWEYTRRTGKEAVVYAGSSAGAAERVAVKVSAGEVGAG